MKIAVIAALITSFGATGVALAQDGSGHGPPKRASVVFLAQSSASQTSAASKIFQPKSILLPAK
jgi:hypothetical protein